MATSFSTSFRTKYVTVERNPSNYDVSRTTNAYLRFIFLLNIHNAIAHF